MTRSSRSEREARERARRYQARQRVHARSIARRRRDNLLVATAGVLLLVLATVAQVVYFGSGPGAPAPAPSAGTTDGATAPDPAVAEARTWNGSLVIDGAELGFELRGDAAPQAVASFVSLAREGFYDGASCDRLTTDAGFRVLQCGSAAGDGSAPGFTFGPIENSPTDGAYPAGTIAMARAADDPSSMGSAFFIVYDDTVLPGDAAGGYTVIGTVTTGLDGLRSRVTELGTVGGVSDGAPVAPALIAAVTVE